MHVLHRLDEEPAHGGVVLRSRAERLGQSPFGRLQVGDDEVAHRRVLPVRAFERDPLGSPGFPIAFGIFLEPLGDAPDVRFALSGKNRERECSTCHASTSTSGPRCGHSLVGHASRYWWQQYQRLTSPTRRSPAAVGRGSGLVRRHHRRPRPGPDRRRGRSPVATARRRRLALRPGVRTLAAAGPRRLLPGGGSGVGGAARRRPRESSCAVRRPSPPNVNPALAASWWHGSQEPSSKARALVVVSSSGRTPVAIEAATAAREMGLLTIGITGSQQGQPAHGSPRSRTAHRGFTRRRVSEDRRPDDEPAEHSRRGGAAPLPVRRNRGTAATERASSSRSTSTMARPATERSSSAIPTSFPIEPQGRSRDLGVRPSAPAKPRPTWSW